jgi:hypothetical protein
MLNGAYVPFFYVLKGYFIINSKDTVLLFFSIQQSDDALRVTSLRPMQRVVTITIITEIRPG